MTNDWTDIHVIFPARVPIIKARNKHEGVDCDISISNGLGVRNTELIKYFFYLQPRLREMVCFLKLWMKKSELFYAPNNNTLFSNYALTLLVIFYLQDIKLLPSIIDLQKNVPPMNIGPWNCSFEFVSQKKFQKTLTNPVGLQSELKGFFRFYSSMEIFLKYVLSIYLGQKIPKENFKHVDLIPNSLAP